MILIHDFRTHLVFKVTIIMHLHYLGFNFRFWFHHSGPFDFTIRTRTGGEQSELTLTIDMNKGILDERDNPKALLVPGTVPLPVHNLVNMNDSSDSEDNLPSTIDFDALKVSLTLVRNVSIALNSFILLSLSIASAKCESHVLMSNIFSQTPGLAETSFPNVMSWRGGTPRAKLKQASITDSPKKDSNLPFVVETAASLSDASKSREESSSGSEVNRTRTCFMSFIYLKN